MIMLSSLINDTNNAVNKYKYCDSISMLQSCIDYLRDEIRFHNSRISYFFCEIEFYRFELCISHLFSKMIFNLACFDFFLYFELEKR